MYSTLHIQLLHELVDKPEEVVAVPTFDHAVKDPVTFTRLTGAQNKTSNVFGVSNHVVQVEGGTSILPCHRLVIVEGIYVLLEDEVVCKKV